MAFDVRNLASRALHEARDRDNRKAADAGLKVVEVAEPRIRAHFAWVMFHQGLIQIVQQWNEDGCKSAIEYEGNGIRVVVGGRCVECRHMIQDTDIVVYFDCDRHNREYRWTMPDSVGALESLERWVGEQILPVICTYLLGGEPPQPQRAGLGLV